jgi:hypothetical protein
MTNRSDGPFNWTSTPIAPANPIVRHQAQDQSFRPQAPGMQSAKGSYDSSEASSYCIAKHIVVKTEDIHEHDVLCGRGDDLYCRSGNKYFRKLVDERKTAYLKTIRRSGKRLIAQEVVDLIHRRTPRGRFLAKVKPDDANGQHTSRPPSRNNKFNKVALGWVEISNARALEKASQALRENAPALRKKMILSDGKKDKDAKNEQIAKHANARIRSPIVMSKMARRAEPPMPTLSASADFEPTKTVICGQEQERTFCSHLLHNQHAPLLSAPGALMQPIGAFHGAGSLQYQKKAFGSEEAQSFKRSSQDLAVDNTCSTNRIIVSDSTVSIISLSESSTQATSVSTSPVFKTRCVANKCDSSSRRKLTAPSTSVVGSSLEKRCLSSKYVLTKGERLRYTNISAPASPCHSWTQQELSVLGDLAMIQHDERRQSTTEEPREIASAALPAALTECANPLLSPLLNVCPITYHPGILAPQGHSEESHPDKYNINDVMEQDSLERKHDDNGGAALSFYPVARSRKRRALSTCSSFDDDSLSLSCDDDAKGILLSPKTQDSNHWGHTRA